MPRPDHLHRGRSATALDARDPRGDAAGRDAAAARVLRQPVRVLRPGGASSSSTRPRTRPSWPASTCTSSSAARHRQGPAQGPRRADAQRPVGPRADDGAGLREGAWPTSAATARCRSRTCGRSCPFVLHDKLTQNASTVSSARTDSPLRVWRRGPPARSRPVSAPASRLSRRRPGARCPWSCTRAARRAGSKNSNWLAKNSSRRRTSARQRAPRRISLRACGRSRPR